MYCTREMNHAQMSHSYAAGDCTARSMFGAMAPLRLSAMIDAARCFGRLPATDIKEDAAKYVILMNLPGIAKDHVVITSEEGGLNIRTTEDDKKEDETLKLVYRERLSGTYQRQFHFEEPVDIENVTARMENGVLELTVPKKVQSTDTKTIRVD